MKTSIRIVLLDNIDKPHYEISYYNCCDKDAEVIIFTDNKHGLKELLSNKKELEKSLYRSNLDYIYLNEHDDELQFDIVENIDTLLSNIIYISFDASIYPYNKEYNSNMEVEGIEEYPYEKRMSIIKDYLNNYPEYKEEAIIIPGNYDINTDYEALEEEYKDYKKLYVVPMGEEEPITIDVAKKNDLSSTIEMIRELNLSPLETVILVYDLVKEKPYKEESINASKYDSRSTYNAINGDSIVCVGYSNILESILSELGFRIILDKLDYKDETKGGHVRNAIYIDDPKYDIKGVYLMDATCDSNTCTFTDDYLYKYRFFLKIPGSFNKMDEQEGLIDRSLGFFNKHSVSEWDHIYEYADSTLMDYIGHVDKFKERGYTTSTVLNLFYLLFDKKYEFYDDNRKEIVKELREKEDEIKSLIGNKIPAHKIAKAIATVRHIENQMDEDKYVFDPKRIAKTVYNCGYPLDYDYLLNQKNDATRLLELLFGVKTEEICADMDDEAKQRMAIRNFCEEFYLYCEELNRGTHKVIKAINVYNKDTKRK